jgi:hypothetical protein
MNFVVNYTIYVREKFYNLNVHSAEALYTYKGANLKLESKNTNWF